MQDLALSIEHVQYVVLIFVRISTIMALLPIFGASYVPTQLKVALSLLLSIALFSTLLASGLPDLASEFSLGMFILMVIKEAAVGLAIGFASSFLFTAVQFAGRLIDTEMGFGFVELADPFSGDQVTALGQFQVIIFTILFLLFNGHYFLLLSIQRSFDVIPLMAAEFNTQGLSIHITSMISNIFILAIRLSAPIFVTLILTEISMGIVARTVPQINIFFVGLPLKVLVGLGTLFIALPMLAALFRSMVDQLIQDIWRLLYLMA
ncbi:flagellar biosynthetic protein FliR [Chitinispirillales bacterium ANBcel5]|uniref:flagellar biosynthetic protein FliR n=1 Tax=Cellulosispirillum alkaliphilum TaxID=3039283 RepID=UPI002A57F7CB|nr:flagellar biosynthetic protein FliR [Chitinispirillales bacterium ANBcel5]